MTLELYYERSRTKKRCIIAAVAIVLAFTVIFFIELTFCLEDKRVKQKLVSYLTKKLNQSNLNRRESNAIAAYLHTVVSFPVCSAWLLQN